MVREAFLKVVPRRQILDTLVAPVHRHAPLRSSWLVLPGAEHYSTAVAANGSAAFDDVDVAGAQRLLASAGVEHPSVCVLFDSGNPRRKEEFALLRASAERAGFAVSDCSSPDWANLLGTPGAYDAALFAWSESNSSTSGAVAVFGTGGTTKLQLLLQPEDGCAARPNSRSPRTPHSRRRCGSASTSNCSATPTGCRSTSSPSWSPARGGISGPAPSARAAGILWNVWKWTSANSR